MWDIKYRPVKFADVLGQDGAARLLKRRLADGTALDTSYLFSGGHGQGKTTLARILARAALCQQLDKADPEPCNVCDNCRTILDGSPGAFAELDAASGGTIDVIRGIVDDLPFAVFGAEKRIYMFDEAHRMSVPGQDVLLKPVEDKKLVGIFCTTEPDKIRGTIRSRCEEYAIRKVTRDDLLGRMRYVLTSEAVAFDEDAVLTVIDASGGHVRDILNRLEMVAQTGSITLDAVREFLHLDLVSVYYQILLALSEPRRAIDLIEQACERAASEVVAAGLAEAAMNSYRLAHKMFADFVYADRTLGEQVYAKYGLGTLKLAELFTSRHPYTKVSLLCDVLSLMGGVPAMVSSGAPVIQIVAQALPAQALPAQVVAEAPVVALPSLPAAPQPSQPAPAPSAPPPAAVRKSLPPGMRADGVGPRGVDDLALTDLDHAGVPQERPRGSEAKKQVINFNKASDETIVLSPDEWRREFSDHWRGTGH